MSTSKPNILFIMTDQHRADHLGCYGNKIPKTPNIDSIAANGVTFDKVLCGKLNMYAPIEGNPDHRSNAYQYGRAVQWPASASRLSKYFCPYPASGATNCALWQKPSTKRLSAWGGGDWNYPAYRDGVVPPKGYRDPNLSLRQGKDYDNEQADLWLSNPAREITTPYYGFEEVRFSNAHGDGVHGHYTGWARSQHLISDSLIGPKNAEPQEHILNPIAWKTRVPEELYSTTFVEQMTTKYLEENASSDKPFFYSMLF